MPFTKLLVMLYLWLRPVPSWCPPSLREYALMMLDVAGRTGPWTHTRILPAPPCLSTPRYCRGPGACSSVPLPLFH